MFCARLEAGTSTRLNAGNGFPPAGLCPSRTATRALALKRSATKGDVLGTVFGCRGYLLCEETAAEHLSGDGVDLWVRDCMAQLPIRARA